MRINLARLDKSGLRFHNLNVPLLFQNQTKEVKAAVLQDAWL